MVELKELGWALERLAQQQGMPLDVNRLGDLLEKGAEPNATQVGVDALYAVVQPLGWLAPQVLRVPDRAHLPLLAYVAGQWGLITDTTPDGGWIFMQAQHRVALPANCWFTLVVRLRPNALGSSRRGSFSVRVRTALLRYKASLTEAITASFFINLLAALTAFYSMQVYDKVIPTHNVDTLIVLSIGVSLLILLEWVMKQARSRVMDRAIVGMDSSLSREIFERFLAIRIDQIPPSVGSLAGQLRGYEQVRNFYTASTLFTLVDVPAAFIFLAVIASVASVWLAVVPLGFSLVALAVGLYFRRRVEQLAKTGVRESNMKTGLLVEVVEGAETIKAAQGGWRFLSRWVDVCAQAIGNDLHMRHANEGLQYFMVAAQQLSYVMLVALGAWFVVHGEMTQGALIASSMLSGRVLSAVMMLPSLMVQHAHAKAASDGIEAIYARGVDNEGIERPLSPSHLQGSLRVEGMVYAYPEMSPSVQVSELSIAPGERVGIIGPIGSGKSTLLKVLAGLYKPTQGRVLLSGLDISHLARETISRHVGYLQQEHRLFQGTLRENLLTGLSDPGDDVMLAALAQTGLDKLVLSHPRGLQLPIFEGGTGLSGGQTQLVAFTRLLLTAPEVLLLDEPTASMDDVLEQSCLRVLRQEPLAKSTLILVTHKQAPLALVDRLIVLVQGRVVMDGPRDAVLERLRRGDDGQTPVAPAENHIALGKGAKP